MNRIQPIALGSTWIFRELGPIDVSTFPSTVVTAGSCTGRLFDDDKDSRIEVAVSSGTSIVVEDIRPFEVGDLIYVMLDTLVWHNAGALVSKDATTRTLVVTTAIPSSVRIGQRVSVKLGADISMVAFGTPVVGTFDWGYSGFVAATHAGLIVGMHVRAESDINAGANQRLVQSYNAVVIGGT